MGKTMSQKSRINRIRAIYAMLIGIMAVFILLFILNVVSAADPIPVAGMGEKGDEYSMMITDLQPQQGRQIGEAVTADSNKATLLIHRYDAVFSDESSESGSEVVWCMVLQAIGVVAFVAMVLLALASLIAFYISVRRGKVFPKKKIRWLTWAGVLMIVMSLCLDASTWIEQSLAASMLQGTGWEPAATMQLHIGRLVFGLTIIFMAQIFYYGREIQEEQELTI